MIFQGVKFVGKFDLDGDEAESMLAAPSNPNGRFNSEVVKLWTTGNDVTGRALRRWVIDFGADRTEGEAALFERPFEHVLRLVKPVRDHVLRETRRVNWWKHGELNRGMREAFRGLSRVISTPEVSKHRIFVWRPTSILPTGSLYSIIRDDDTSFGVLQSRCHEVWALRMGTSLGPTPRYTPSTTFETFPFPAGLTPDIPASAYAADPRAQAIAMAAARLNELRENWLNPADLVVRAPEVVAGYLDRILPKDEAAAKLLAKRTLTNLYNERPAWLDHAHRALDAAVADAYGWGDDWRAGLLTDDEMLKRLFELNQQRAGVV
jgi:type II restriction/modification system DNA methylase subunit YeeA